MINTRTNPTQGQQRSSDVHKKSGFSLTSPEGAERIHFPQKQNKDSGVRLEDHRA